MKKRLRLWVKVFIFIIILALITILYGLFINSYGFKVKEIVIHENIDYEYDDFKIVHMSDIYYGNSIDKNGLKRIIKRVNLIKPDIVVFTGDLLYKNIKKKDELIKLLTSIDPNIGKYYITGDNDYNDEIVNDILDSSGFININNNYKLIYKSKKPILIAGIGTKKMKKDTKSIDDYLEKNNVYSILITHEPDNIKSINLNNYNLVLAGHNLGGLINIPYVGGIMLNGNLYNKSYYKKHDTKIYISNGLGNSNVNFRLFNKPSFSYYRLRKK